MLKSIVVPVQTLDSIHHEGHTENQSAFVWYFHTSVYRLAEYLLTFSLFHINCLRPQYPHYDNDQYAKCCNVGATSDNINICVIHWQLLKVLVLGDPMLTTLPRTTRDLYSFVDYVLCSVWHAINTAANSKWSSIWFLIKKPINLSELWRNIT